MKSGADLPVHLKQKHRIWVNHNSYLFHDVPSRFTMYLASLQEIISVVFVCWCASLKKFSFEGISCEQLIFMSTDFTSILFETHTLSVTARISAPKRQLVLKCQTSVALAQSGGFQCRCFALAESVPINKHPVDQAKNLQYAASKGSYTQKGFAFMNRGIHGFISNNRSTIKPEYEPLSIL